MENPKIGDIVVKKMDVGEPSLTVYVIEDAGNICSIVPLMKMAYNLKTHVYSGEGFVIENRPHMLAFRYQLASICCINLDSTLTKIICSNPFLEKSAKDEYSSLKEAKIESHILEHE